MLAVGITMGSVQAQDVDPYELYTNSKRLAQTLDGMPYASVHPVYKMDPNGNASKGMLPQSTPTQPGLFNYAILPADHPSMETVIGPVINGRVTITIQAKPFHLRGSIPQQRAAARGEDWHAVANTNIPVDPLPVCRRKDHYEFVDYMYAFNQQQPGVAVDMDKPICHFKGVYTNYIPIINDKNPWKG